MSATKPEVVGPLAWWHGKHRDHGRCGPFPDTSMHTWNVWRCPCGSRFYVDKDGAGKAMNIGESRP